MCMVKCRHQTSKLSESLGGEKENLRRNKDNPPT